MTTRGVWRAIAADAVDRRSMARAQPRAGGSQPRVGVACACSSVGSVVGRAVCGTPVAARRAKPFSGMDQSDRTTGAGRGLNNRRRVATDARNQQFILPGPARKPLICNKCLQWLQRQRLAVLKQSSI